MKNSLLFLICTVSCTQAMEDRLASVNNGTMSDEHDWCNFLVDVNALIKKECHVRDMWDILSIKKNINKDETALGLLRKRKQERVAFGKYMCNVRHCTVVSVKRDGIKYHRRLCHEVSLKHCSFPFCSTTYETTAGLKTHVIAHSHRLARFKSFIEEVNDDVNHVSEILAAMKL
ncbi:MAG: hypothetical protein WC707_00895 [Candidatus Babeliaceae bacterium]|jgi:hypothetical protein